MPPVVPNVEPGDDAKDEPKGEVEPNEAPPPKTAGLPNPAPVVAVSKSFNHISIGMT